MLHGIELAGDDDVDGFRLAARRLILAGIEPVDVGWHVATSDVGDLFALATERPDEVTRPAATLKLPAWFVPLCESALLHADARRHGLLYRLAWRLVHEPALRGDPLDPDRLQAEGLARAVRRDQHKMTAFVRFRPPDEPGGVHVAWFEPDHHVVAATAPFFARRFAQMHWAILTPRRCVRWDGRVLAFGPGARRDEAPPVDAAVTLWLTYYESIFNPARLKLSMMRKEMPQRYWKNLPEAAPDRHAVGPGRAAQCAHDRAGRGRAAAQAPDGIDGAAARAARGRAGPQRPRRWPRCPPRCSAAGTARSVPPRRRPCPAKAPATRG